MMERVYDKKYKIVVITYLAYFVVTSPLSSAFNLIPFLNFKFLKI